MVVSQLDFAVALILGLAPCLLILWWSIRRFDLPFTQYRLFDDRRLFGSFAVGMIFGVLASFLEVNSQAIAVDLTASIVVLVTAPLFEELFKLVYLNRKGYRERFDTTYYGVALGTGAASTSIVATAIGPSLGSLYNPVGVSLLIVYAASLSLIHSDTGALIGFGASRGDPWGSLRKALLVRFGHLGLLLPFVLVSSLQGGEAPSAEVLAAALSGLLASLALAGIIYHYVYTALLPGTLPEDIRREMQREKRRARKSRA